MTYQDAARESLAVQDACNLSGVVFSFAEVMHAICEEQNRLGEGTQWKNQNPIVTLYLSKLGDLNGIGWHERDYYHAQEQVKKIAEGVQS